MNSKERKEKIKPEAVFMIGGKPYQILKVEDSNADWFQLFIISVTTFNCEFVSAFQLGGAGALEQGNN